jgi:hypothetical protein
MPRSPGSTRRSAGERHGACKIDMNDPAYYTVADGDGQTTAAREAVFDVGGDQRPALVRRIRSTHD